MSYPSKTDRETILATAMDQVARDGIQKLAIRSVAASLGLAPNALYRYFANLAALKASLGEESRRLVLEAIRKAAGKKPPEEAIRSIARAYVRFAREHPQVFSLTLMPSAAETEDDAGAAHLQSWHFVLEHVARIYGEKRAPEAAVALWAFLHGMTALEAAGVFGERKPASSFEFGLRMWIRAASAKD
jgi:AcrR family transcriptional regulator